ncbi:MAG: DNA cytosine methyltransferase [Methanobrevibacter sp.]|nr:DNA cytosine methyltransferase [Methanobrevibacter sp.]
MEIKILGGLGEKWGNTYRQGNRVYDSEGLAATLTAEPLGNHDGYSSLYLIKENEMESDRQDRIVARVTPDRSIRFYDSKKGTPISESQFQNPDNIADTILTNGLGKIYELPAILKSERNEYGKEIRKSYEKHKISEKRAAMKQIVPREDGLTNTLTTVQKDNLVLENGFFRQAIETAENGNAEVGDVIDAFNGRINKSGVSPTITTRPEGKKTAILPVVEDNAMSEQKSKKSGYAIRKLTERECWRLMGFTDKDFNKAAGQNSATQLYRQSGNSIVRQVLMAIFLQMGIQGKKRWNQMSVEERQNLVTNSLDFLGEKND